MGTNTTMDPLPVARARAILMDARYDKDGISCPCCEQFAKVYRRSITLTEVKVMAKIYNVARKACPQAPDTHWIKIGADGDLRTMGGDYAKSRFWGLIEERPGERADGSTRVGQWRITESGIEFLLGAKRVPRYVWVYNNEVVAPPPGTENKTISVYDVAKKFDFRSIIEAP